MSEKGTLIVDKTDELYGCRCDCYGIVELIVQLMFRGIHCRKRYLWDVQKGSYCEWDIGNLKVNIGMGFKVRNEVIIPNCRKGGE